MISQVVECRAGLVNWKAITTRWLPGSIRNGFFDSFVNFDKTKLKDLESESDIFP